MLVWQRQEVQALPLSGGVTHNTDRVNPKPATCKAERSCAINRCSGPKILKEQVNLPRIGLLKARRRRQRIGWIRRSGWIWAGLALVALLAIGTAAYTYSDTRHAGGQDWRHPNIVWNPLTSSEDLPS